MKTVLTKLRENHLYIKGEKCEFHVPQVSFLGYMIDQHGVAMDNEKVMVVAKWLVPTTIKGLQRFLGFASFYRCFIPGFSSMAAPMMPLFKKGSEKLQWND